MAEKHDNQYTSPPMTHAEVMAKASQVLRRQGKGAIRHDRMALFAEWLRSEPSQFRTSKCWFNGKHPEVNPGSLQKWGGRTFWNKAREVVRAEALSKAISKTPDILERKFEQQLKINVEAEGLVSKLIRQLCVELESVDSKDRKFLEARVRTLVEAVQILNENTLKLANDGVERHEVKSVNLHASIMDAIKERDARLGVVE